MNISAVSKLKRAEETIDGNYRALVLDDNDPDKLNRIKVFVYGVYDDSLIDKKEELPWALPAKPLFGKAEEICVPKVGQMVWCWFDKSYPLLQPIYFALATSGPDITRIVKSVKDKLNKLEKERLEQAIAINPLATNFAKIEKLGETKDLTIIESDKSSEISDNTKGSEKTYFIDKKSIEIVTDKKIEFIKDKDEFIKQNKDEVVGKDKTEYIVGDKYETVAGNKQEFVNDNYTIFVTGKYDLTVADIQKIQSLLTTEITATTSVTIKTLDGLNSIIITPAGITINGTLITINGAVKINGICTATAYLIG